MLEWMRRNNKKLLAVFTVGLMIAFAFTPQWGKGQRDDAYSVGEINGRKVMTQDLAGPAYYWDFLKNNIFVQGREGPVPIVMLLGRTPTGVDPQLSQQLVKQIEDNHAMLYLLLDEAHRMGVTVSDAEINNACGAISIRVGDEKGARLLDFDTVAQTETGDRVRAAIAQYLTIQKSYNRATSVIKISQPLLESDIALSTQQVKLSVVEFLTPEFASKVPAPTTQQLQVQFEKFADKLPQIDPRTNPAGFGYEYPDRVSLQYVQIPRDQLQQVVRTSRDDNRWEVDAIKYYNKHQQEFPSTQPSRLAPTTNNAFSLAPTSQPATQPTTRPFAEVKNDIVEKLVRPEVDKLEEQISKRIVNTMSLDYVAYRGTLSTGTGPSTQPKTSLGAPYGSFEYLQALKADIERQFKVTIKIEDLGDKYFSAKELGSLPALKEAFLITNNQARPAISLAEYAIGFAEKLQPEGSRRQDGILSSLSPSRPLTDFLGNTYIFRLKDAKPAQRPASMAEVQTTVEADWKAQTAVELAQKAAEALRDAAAAQSLESAATADGRKVISTGWLGGNTSWRDSNLNITDESRPGFAQQIVALFAQAAKDRTKPIYGIVSLPRDNKVLLVRLDNSKPVGPEQEIARDRVQVAAEYQGALASNLPLQWFRYENVKVRTHYVDKMELRKKAQESN